MIDVGQAVVFLLFLMFTSNKSCHSDEKMALRPTSDSQTELNETTFRPPSKKLKKHTIKSNRRDNDDESTTVYGFIHTLAYSRTNDISELEMRLRCDAMRRDEMTTILFKMLSLANLNVCLSSSAIRFVVKVTGWRAVTQVVSSSQIPNRDSRMLRIERC